MTQTDKSVNWLVKVPAGCTDSFNTLLIKTCRGNERIAALLNYFLYEAAYKAKNTKIDLTQAEYIRLENITLATIVQGIQKLNRSASKKTIIKWIVKLQSWSLLQSNGYRQTYDIYFKKVQEAFDVPPLPEQIKPRGKYAQRDCTFKNRECNSSHADCTFKKNGKSTISAQNGEDCTFKNGGIDDQRIVVLTEQIVVLQSQNVILRDEIVKLQSAQSSEQACRAALEAKIEALYNIHNIHTIISNKNVSDEIANLPTDNPPQKVIVEEKQLPTKQVTRKEEPAKQEQLILPEPVLPENEQIVYANWSAMPWFKSVPPKQTPTLLQHLKTLVAYSPLPTTQEMLNTRNWAVKNKEGLYKGKGWQLGNFVSEYPNYLSTQYSNAPTITSAPTPKQPTILTHDEAQKLAVMIVEDAKAKGYEVTALAFVQDGKWAVKLHWLRNEQFTIDDIPDWKRFFAELHETEVFIQEQEERRARLQVV